MRRVFKTCPFARWLRKTDLDDAALCRAVADMERGPIDADLGGGVLKKRGARTLVATNRGDRWFFVFGFEKNVRANVSTKELEALQALATDLLKLSSVELDRQVERDTLSEICHDSAE